MMQIVLFQTEKEREEEREESGSNRAIIKVVGSVSHTAFNYLQEEFFLEENCYGKKKFNLWVMGKL